MVLLTATQNRLYDVSMLNIQTMTVTWNKYSYGMRTTTGRSVHGSETEFSLASCSNKISVIANDNIYFEEPKMVASSN